MDKAIFLFDKDCFAKEQIENLTWEDCEKLVADETYNYNDAILKIDATNYNSVTDALLEEGIDDTDFKCHIKAFGFDEPTFKAYADEQNVIYQEVFDLTCKMLDKTPNKALGEDNFYTIAHDTFLDACAQYAKENPHVADDEDDEVMWYDALLDMQILDELMETMLNKLHFIFIKNED